MMKMEIIRQSLKPKYETLNEIEIDAKNILDNFNYIQSLVGSSEIIPVLKANAYGHGLKELCLILNYSSAKILAVDSYPEAQIVYKHSKSRVLILNEMALGAYKYAKFKRTEFVVYTEKTLRYLAKLKKRAKIHLFVNTGMNREGIKDLPKFLENNVKYLKNLELNGLCSHLASADSDSYLNEKQLSAFQKNLEIIKEAGFNPKYIHLNNSAATLSSKVKVSFLNAHRVGLALFGYHPSLTLDSKYQLKPALEAFSHLSAVYPIKAGEIVSYNEKFIAKQDTNIAIIPFGYYEGLNTNLSNKAKFLLLKDNVYLQIAGQVCMNITCLDLKDNTANLGDKIKIISKDKNAPNSLANLSQISSQSIYEILANISQNIRRTIVNLKF